MAFFVKYEFWYHYLQQLAVNNIPVYSVSSIFRQDQLFFKWYGGFYRKTLSFITQFFVQNEESNRLLQSIGIKNITITGDTRFDRVWALKQTTQEIHIVKSFVGAEKTIVAGSTWPQDEEYLLPSFIKLLAEANYKLKLIIAPHEISETQVQHLQKYFGERAIRYSLASNVDLSAYSVLIIDNIGLLSALYCYASVAYIGGGFGKGIHNILEAATYSTPIVFGPNYSKFQEATDLINQGGAYSVSTAQELSAIFTELLNDDSVNKHAASICGDYVNAGKGATARIMEKIHLV
jgi:3-deoxy-D-manno-octulosonic-acid transferase